MAQLNYENLTEPTHNVVTTAIGYDSTGVFYFENKNTQPVNYVPLRKNSSMASEELNQLSDGTPVTLLREWSSGDSSWAYVRVTESELEGYILTRHIVKREDFSLVIAAKSKIDLRSMTPMERALVPNKSWMGEDAPYYHIENGEWWFSVTLPYTCIEEGTLEDKKKEAKLKATQEMYSYFDINPADNPLIPSEVVFQDSHQTTYVKDYFLSTRPGSELMMLVIIPAVYVQYLRENTLPSEIGNINEEFCISLAANSMDDLTGVQEDIVKCLVRQFQLYVNSNVEVTNFSFEDEIFKQTQAISQIKFLLNQNDIDLGSSENQTAASDACVASPINRKVKVCFDENYMLKAVYYYNNKGEEKLLSSGLNHVKNSFPFNEKRFGSLFLNHPEICSLPELKLKDFFEEYVVDPKPDFKVVTYNTRTSKKLTPYAVKELGVYVDTALFLTSLAKEFGNVFDLNTAGGLGFNCYSSNKSVDAFKEKALAYRDSQFMFSGDIMAFFQFICNLKFEDAEEAVEKAGKDSETYGWGWLLGDSAVWDAMFSLTFSDFRMPSFSLIEAIKSGSEKAFKAAVNALIAKIIEFFLRVKCELLLAGITALGALAAGVSIGAYYASQDKKNKLGEGTAALPSPADLAIRDYGGENCNDILQESLGYSNESYDFNLLQIFLRCGAYIPAEQGGMAREYLDSVSKMVSPIELLALLEGSASNALINEVLKHTQKNFPVIYEFKNTNSKISALFTCLGENTTQEAIEKAENKIKEKVNDEEFCINVSESLKDIMKDKCPSPEVYESIYEKEFGSKIETYQEIIDLLQDECKNIKINLFNDPDTGEKGILNVLNGKVKGQDKFLDNVGESILGSTRIGVQGDSGMFYSNPVYQQMLHKVTDTFLNPPNNDLIKDYTSTGGLDTGTIYAHNDAEFEDSPTYFIINPDGTSEIKTSQGSQAENTSQTLESVFPAYSLPDSVENILQNSENANYFIDTINISKQQGLFYAFIEEYISNNTKNQFGDKISLSSPVPFGVTNIWSDPSEVKEELFPAIISSIINLYARKVGFNWEGEPPSQQNSLIAYSNSISANFHVENIMNYNQAKQEIKQYFDVAEYDDLNNDKAISPKQFAMMNGTLYAFVRLHIFEYLATAMPFYQAFSNIENDFTKDAYNAYPEIVKGLIKNRIYKSLSDYTQASLEGSTGFINRINETYDFVKKRSSYEIKSYTGQEYPDRGLSYYIDYNYKSVYDAFTLAITQVQPDFKKSQTYIQNGNFIYSTTKALEVHKHAGLISLFDGDDDEGVPSIEDKKGGQLGGTNVSFVSDLTEKNYSLFKGDRYNKFRHGMFFIQNYFYIEDKEAEIYINDRKKFDKGVLNRDNMHNITEHIPDAQKEKALKTIFKTVKHGSRLCYGIAVGGGGNNGTPDIASVAKKIFLNYQKDGYENNSGNLTSTSLQVASDSFPLQKYMVCVDGPNPDFKYNGFDGWTKPSDGPGTSFNTSLEWQYTSEGSYSIVIPIFNVEEEYDMDLTWNDLMNEVNSSSGKDISEIQKFKNLNTILITDSRYSAMIKSCFPLENLIHFNAIYGTNDNNLGSFDKFVAAKSLFAVNILNIINAKNAT